MVWTMEPVYIVYWVSEGVVQTPYLLLESISPRRPGGPGHVLSPTLMSWKTWEDGNVGA